MNRNNKTLIRSAGVFAGMLMALLATVSSAATFPALPSFETVTAWLSTRDYMVLGAAALVVAVVAGVLAFWVIRRRRHHDVVAQGPDLRWWRNP